MKRSSTLLRSKKLLAFFGDVSFLKIVILLIAIGVLAGLLWFPQTEGRAKNLDLINIYNSSQELHEKNLFFEYKDPFIIYIYIGSVPFFVGLYQAFKLLNFIDANKAFSQGAVNTLKNMKFASLSLIGFITPALFYIRFAAVGDDPAGPTALGVLASFAAAVIGTAAGVFQKLLQNAVDMKSEHDLTV